MLDPDRHLGQARANLRVLRQLLTLHTEHRDPAILQWATTVAFYVSVHLVEAWLRRDFKESTVRHTARRAKLEEHAPERVLLAHNRLHDWSSAVRYNGAKVSQEQFDAQVLVWLNTVLTFVGEPRFSPSPSVVGE